MKLALALALAALAAPALARAEPASILTHDLPVAGERALAGATKTPPFTLVGFHWRGKGTVSFRTRALGGRWSGWHAAAPEPEDGPDGASRESSLRRDGWRLGNPYWTGLSDRIEYRVRGHVTRLRVHLVRSDPEPGPVRTLTVAGAPPIVPRLSWGANELLKRAPPSYADATKLAVVHHTAGSNSYTRAEAAAIVKAIQLYHVRGNGWNDIGYNLLVDKYGQVFEGRFGGMTRNVVGAHAQGFNTGSVGVAVLGNYERTTVTPAARDALVRVLAWRLDLAHVDPLSTLNWISGGNPRFPRGVPVFLPAVAGHRDTGFTACPGDGIYGGLGGLARAVALSGAPKIFAPTVRGTLGGAVRFSARLSSALPWAVRITDAARATIASGTGVGTVVNWTWDATFAPAGSYAWSISVAGARPATGVLGRGAAALALTRVRAEPAAITPNGDGQADSAMISYTLGAPATVTATLTDPTGLVLTTLFSEPKPAGPHSFQFAAENLVDGTYGIVLAATGLNGRTVTASTTVLVSRTLAGLAVSQKVFSPNGDGRLDTLTFAFSLGAPADVKLRILRAGRWVATPLAGPLPAGPQAFTWDGAKRFGRLLDGTYEAEVSAAGETGTIAQRIPFTADSTPPVLRLLSRRPLRFRVSEPAEVVLVLGRAKQIIRRLQAGPFTVPLRVGPRRLRAVAWDAAGNTSRPVRRR